VADLTQWSDDRLTREVLRQRGAPGPALSEFERRIKAKADGPVPDWVRGLAKTLLADLARLYAGAGGGTGPEERSAS
jgi:hypothetical protein